VSEVFRDFTDLMAVKRGQTESFRNFEGRFAAQVAKFHAHSDDVKLPESLIAFMLLGNSNIDSGQRISVLASAAPNVTAADAVNVRNQKILCR